MAKARRKSYVTSQSRQPQRAVQKQHPLRPQQAATLPAYSTYTRGDRRLSSCLCAQPPLQWCQSAVRPRCWCGGQGNGEAMQGEKQFRPPNSHVDGIRSQGYRSGIKTPQICWIRCSPCAPSLHTTRASHPHLHARALPSPPLTPLSPLPLHPPPPPQTPSTSPHSRQ